MKEARNSETKSSRTAKNFFTLLHTLNLLIVLNMEVVAFVAFVDPCVRARLLGHSLQNFRVRSAAAAAAVVVVVVVVPYRLLEVAGSHWP